MAKLGLSYDSAIVQPAWKDFYANDISGLYMTSDTSKPYYYPNAAKLSFYIDDYIAKVFAFESGAEESAYLYQSVTLQESR